MQMRSVHERVIDAPAPVLGRLVDGLGSEHDRLWPGERWPTMPLAFDRPLGPGARGGHGSIRYVVEEHVPRQRVAFRFAPGLGLAGTHRFDVEAVDSGRSRLVHTLDARVEPKLIPTAPVLRAYHDAILEDLLDRAELAATGRVKAHRRPPAWLRALNATDVAVARLKARVKAAARA